MPTNHEILVAARKKFGRNFKTVREVQIYLSAQEQAVEEISEADMQRLAIGCGLPFNFTEIATCQDDAVESVREQLQVKLLQTTTLSNQLHAQPKRSVCRIEHYVNGVLTNVTEV